MADKLDAQNADSDQGGFSTNPNATGPVMKPVTYQCADSFDGKMGNGLADQVNDEGDYVASYFKGKFGDGK